jgi:hypothetical protein
MISLRADSAEGGDGNTILDVQSERVDAVSALTRS